MNSSEKLYKEIVESKRLGKLTPEAANILIKMSQQISNRMAYPSSLEKNRALQYGLNSVIKNWDNINMKLAVNGHVVSQYYSEIIKRGFARGYYRRTKVIEKRKTKIQNIIRILAN